MNERRKTAVVKPSEIKQKFRRVCMEEGGCIGLIFTEAGRKEAFSVKILRQGDDPVKWLDVAEDVERECVALFQLDKQENLSLPKVNIWFAEDLCRKLVSLVVDSAAGKVIPIDMKKGLNRAEISLANSLEEKGTMLSISNKVIEAGMMLVT